MIWKIIQDYPDYAISDSGLVKSMQRQVIRTNAFGTAHLKTINERILKPSKRNGYLFVTLRKNGSHKSNQIHQLVASVFKGKKPTGLVVLHADGNKENNNEWNISYGTKSKNTQDYYKSIGKRSGYIPYKEIPLIIERINKGEEICNIAKEYNVNRNDVAVLNKIISLTGEELEIKL